MGFRAFFLLLAAAHAAVFAAREARAAPLLAGLAARYDQIAPNCPAIGAGGARPQPDLCAGAHPAEDYCNGFSATALLKSDAAAKKSYDSCVRFYTSALAAQQLFCDYEKDADELQAVLTAQANATVRGSSSAEGASSLDWSCAFKTYGYYQDAARRMLADLSSARATAQKDSKALADDGWNSLLTEVHCLRTGTPGKPSGTLQIGLSAHTEAGQKATFDLLSKVLADFAVKMNQMALSSQGIQNRALASQSSLSTISGVKPIPAPAAAPSAADIVGVPGDSSSSAQDAAKASQGAAQSAAKQVGGAIMTNSHVTIKELIKDALLGVNYEAAAGTVGAESQALVFGLGVTYLTKGKVTSLDVTENLYLTGTSITLGMATAPAAVTIGITAGMAFAFAEIRRFWNGYEAQAILEPYQQFVRAGMPGNSSLTSEQLAQKFASQKAQSWYCQDCPAFTGKAGCMQQNPNIAKYNKYGEAVPSRPTR